ncbi:IMP dehydrogenase [Candidatus Marinimicrobia bacterium]|jgi:IMP dehydrogenase|nr:IMP dehydrogenase [Candidatus Neomarinimicrobiota bacterium]|tara:strand:- start:4 stop:1473 length:1470 start_codon:yes stop_codon:yes gene_type:complete
MENKIKFRKGYTFDDVLLVPQKSKVLPKETNLKTRLTNNIKLNIPIISAAMDTVTEEAMAIAMAREGGLGVIHKNCSIEFQKSMVDKVKRSESGMILKPVTVRPNQNINDAKKIMSEFRISGLPVVKEDKLVGIITNRDIRFQIDGNMEVSACMTSENLITVPLDTSLEDAEELLHKHRIEKLLVVNDSGDLAGLITVKDINKKQQYPAACKDNNGRLRVAAAVGVAGDTNERVTELIDAEVDAIVVDTAHGHSRGVLDTISQLKAQHSNISIIAGNVATGYGAEALMDVGVDCVKVGIGAGASCTTRIVAGVGVPQLTAILDAVNVAKKANIPIIADGGLRYSGDIAKALAAGADTIMLGSVLAGMDESPGETILYEGRQYKTFRGMGSIGAMEEGSGDRYFQEDTDNKKLVPEGIEGMVPFRGPVKNTIHQLTGGIRSAMGYCGSRNIGEFGQKSEFIEITSAGIRESHPHEVRIVKEAPNYSPSER